MSPRAALGGPLGFELLRPGWAGLALLEIVRNAPDRHTQQQAFETLWLEHRHSLTAGYALKAVLESQLPDEKMASIAAEYIKGNTSNNALMRRSTQTT